MPRMTSPTMTSNNSALFSDVFNKPLSGTSTVT